MVYTLFLVIGLASGVFGALMYSDAQADRALALLLLLVSTLMVVGSGVVNAINELEDAIRPQK